MGSKSGYTASLTVGAYTGAELTNVSVTLNHEPIEVSDLASVFKERTWGLLDWELTGTKNYVTQAFLTLAKAGRTSVNTIVKNPAGTTMFSCPGLVTRGVANYPMGAATEEITVVGMGSTPYTAAV